MTGAMTGVKAGCLESTQMKTTEWEKEDLLGGGADREMGELPRESSEAEL